MYPEIAGVHSHTWPICTLKYSREHCAVAQVGRNGSFLEGRVVSVAEDSRCTLSCWEQVLLCMSTLNFVKYLFERGGGSSFNLDCENSVLAFECTLLGLSNSPFLMCSLLYLDPWEQNHRYYDMWALLPAPHSSLELALVVHLGSFAFISIVFLLHVAFCVWFLSHVDIQHLNVSLTLFLLQSSGSVYGHTILWLKVHQLINITL